MARPSARARATEHTTSTIVTTPPNTPNPIGSTLNCLRGKTKGEREGDAVDWSADSSVTLAVGSRDMVEAPVRPITEGALTSMVLVGGEELSGGGEVVESCGAELMADGDEATGAEEGEGTGEAVRVEESAEEERDGAVSDVEGGSGETVVSDAEEAKLAALERLRDVDDMMRLLGVVSSVGEEADEEATSPFDKGEGGLMNVESSALTGGGDPRMCRVELATVWLLWIDVVRVPSVDDSDTEEGAGSGAVVEEKKGRSVSRVVLLSEMTRVVVDVAVRVVRSEEVELTRLAVGEGRDEEG